MQLQNKLEAISGNKTVVDLASAVVLYLLLALMLSVPFLFFNQAFYLADMTYNNEPVARFMRDWWQRSGHFPIWNPFVFCGTAQIQVLWPIAYMAGYIFVLLPLAKATGVFLFAHFVIAGIGAYLWQYFHAGDCSAGDGHGAAVLFGVIFMLSGYMTSCTVNLGLLAASIWIPWMLFLIDRVIARPRAWLVGTIAFITGQQVTSGRPELVAVSWLLYVFYLVFSLRSALLSNSTTGARAIWSAVCFLLALTLSVLFAMVDLLPMVDLVRSAPQVGSLATLGATYWKAGWYDFLTVLFSQPLGDWNMSRYHLYPTHPGTMPYVASLYLGPPVMTLAAIGFANKDWRERWFWLVCLAVGVIASSGYFADVASLFRGVFPDYLVFRFPIKLAIIALLSLCVFAAEGWRATSTGGAGKRMLSQFRSVWLLVVAAGLLLPAIPDQALTRVLQFAGLPATEARSVFSQLPAELIVGGLSGLLTVRLCLTSTASLFSFVSRRAIMLLVVTGLLMFNGTRHLWKTVDASFFDQGSEVAQWILSRAGQDPLQFRVLSLLPDPVPAPPAMAGLPAQQLDAAFMQYARSVLKPNCNLDFGMQLSNGASTIPTWASYFIATGLIPRSSLGTGIEHPAGKSDLPLQRWCQSSSTRYILTAANQQGEDGTMQAVPLLDRQLFHLVRQDERLNLRIYEVPNVRPRWTLVTSARAAADFGPALTIINRCDTTAYDPAREVVITDFDRRGTLPVLPPPVDGQSPAGSVSGRSLSDHKFALAVNNILPAYLVVADSFDPGWEARDNGVLTKVYVADGLLRAVYLKPGKHDVVFTYKPRSLFWGEIISKVTLILIGLLVATAVWVKSR